MVITYFGASCTGPEGTWFMNVVEAGPKSTLSPAYRLSWTFSGSKSARPSGTVISASPDGGSVRITLDRGTMRVNVVKPHHADVSGKGTLLVELSGTSMSPSLTFDETGLAGVEREIGLASPFFADGKPLRIPIESTTKLANC